MNSYKTKQNNIIFTKNSFTLIEMMVVVTIMAIIGVAIGTSFVSGVNLWMRAKNIDLARSDVILSLERIARQLRQCIDTQEINFSGKENEIYFPTIIDKQIAKVSYQYDPVNKILSSQQVVLNDIAAGKEEENTQERQIVSVDDFMFEYFYFDEEEEKYLWKQDWEKTEGIFKAVRMRVRFRDEEISKTVFIPIA